MDAIELLRHDHRMAEQLFRDDEPGRELDKAEQTAPTRPHPHAPDRPSGPTPAGPVAAVSDRFRDRLQGRPRT